MATATRICKVCGKEYKYCKTWLNADKFRYQDVACSPECGSVYFANIASSRSESTKDESEVTETRRSKRIAKRSSKKVSADEHAETADSIADKDNTEDTN